MAIYVDVSAAVHGKAGLARYSQSLVQALTPRLGERLRLFQNSLGSVGSLEGWQGAAPAGVREGYRLWRARVLAQQLVRAPMDRLVPNAELFHATEHLLPRFRSVPTVLTVHDLIFQRYPQYHKFKNYAYLRLAMPLYCRRADAIITVSEFSKRDLVRLYGVPEDKVTVIPEAAADHFGPADPSEVERVRDRYGLPQRYLLAVGTIEPRKNLSRLADACGPLLDEGLVDGLVLVGSKGWLFEGFYEHLETLPWRDKVLFPGFVADADLSAVYSGAMIAVQPSLYEGFGLPVLEAMACGSPVCSSDAASLPEVGGDVARYIAPVETEEMIDALRGLLRDPEARRDMSRRGIERARLFSWDRAAEMTQAVYERVIARAGA